MHRIGRLWCCKCAASVHPRQNSIKFAFRTNQRPSIVTSVPLRTTTTAVPLAADSLDATRTEDTDSATESSFEKLLLNTDEARDSFSRLNLAVKNPPTNARHAFSSLSKPTRDRIINSMCNGPHITSRLTVLSEACKLGLQLDETHWEMILKATVALNEGVELLRAILHEHRITPNIHMYEILIGYLAKVSALEDIMLLIEEMEHSNVNVSNLVFRHVITAACLRSEPHLAVQFALACEAGMKSISQIEQYNFQWKKASNIEPENKLDLVVWLNILQVCADHQMLFGINAAWYRCTDFEDFIANESLTISLLNACSRLGKPDFAIEILKRHEGFLEEYHFSPIIEAFSRDGKCTSAADVIVRMSRIKVNPGRNTTVQVFISSLRQFDDQRKEVEEWVENFYNSWQNVESPSAAAINECDRYAHVVVIRSLMDAYVRAGLPKEAIRLWEKYFTTTQQSSPSEEEEEEAAAKKKHTSTRGVIHILLDAAIAMKDFQFGNNIFNDYIASSNSRFFIANPIYETFDRMLHLCSTSNEVSEYEQGFKWIGELEQINFAPPALASSFNEFVKKLLIKNDPRSKEVIEKMGTLEIRLDSTANKLYSQLLKFGKVVKPEVALKAKTKKQTRNSVEV